MARVSAGPSTAERGHRFFARAYARTSPGIEARLLGRHRAALVQQASGVTLDLGAGTGVNLTHLPDAVGRLHLVEPDPHMRARLARSLLRRPLPAGTVVHAVGGEDVPLPDASVDTVLATLTLCSVDDPAAVARELRRVLRPGGRVLVMEHVRSGDERTARWQRRLNPVWTRLAGGCHLDRDTAGVLREAGFDTTDLRRVDVTAPALLRSFVIGAALRRGAEGSAGRPRRDG